MSSGTHRLGTALIVEMMTATPSEPPTPEDLDLAQRFMSGFGETSIIELSEIADATGYDFHDVLDAISVYSSWMLDEQPADLLDSGASEATSG